MKIRKIAISLFILPLITGCSIATIHSQSSVKMDDGTRHYLIKTVVQHLADKDTGQKTLAGRANKVCPEGYVLIDEAERPWLRVDFIDVGDKEITWQFKCKTQS